MRDSDETLAREAMNDIENAVHGMKNEVLDALGELRGIALRDYFAGQALAGLTTTGWGRVNLEWAQAAAQDAYCLADAMLAARGGK